MLWINLGSGRNPLLGAVNVDKEVAARPDVLWDLEQTPWPFEDNSADQIFCTHVLEHLGRETVVFFAVMKEIYRVLKPEAVCEIRVPHVRCSNFWNDPTHVRVITPEIMGLFSKENCAEFAKNKWPNTPLAVYLDIDFILLEVVYKLTPNWSSLWESGQLPQKELDYAANTYWNVIEEITMKIKKIAPNTAEKG